MTVQAIEADITYTFNDEGQYPFAFDILSPRDVTVQFIDNLGVRHVLAMGTDYLVINAAGARHIEIISTCGYIGQQGQLFIYRDMPVEQPTDWVNNEELDMELLEKSFDRVIMILQQFNTQITSELAAITWRDGWKTNTVYKVRDLVQAPNTNIYLATRGHTAGVFETDLLAGKWNLVIDIAVITEYAEAADVARIAAEAAATLANQQLTATEIVFQDTVAIKDLAEQAKNAATLSESNAEAHSLQAWADQQAGFGYMQDAQDAASAAEASADLAALSAANLPNATTGGSNVALTTNAAGNAFDYTPITSLSKSLMAASTAAAHKTLLDLENVDNTSDLNKPVSIAQAAAIDVLPTLADINVSGRLYNGDFQIAQEGTTHNTQGYGSIDGVFLNRVGSGLSVSREFFTLGQADVPGEPVNYARFTVTSVTGANNIAQYQHRIPDVKNYAGGKCFVAFDAKADVAGKTIGVGLEQNFGTGGSANVFTPVQIKTLSNAWTGGWHVFEFDVPSIAGKIIGTGKNDYIAVRIIFDAGSSHSGYPGVGQKSGIYDICKLRVVRNLWELNHYRQSLSDVLDDCYQYYQIITATGVANGFSYMNGAFSPVRGFSFTFKRRMRAIPVAAYTGYTTVGCALGSIICTDQQGVVNVNLTAPGNYVITDGTIRLDARI